MDKMEIDTMKDRATITLRLSDYEKLLRANEVKDSARDVGLSIGYKKAQDEIEALINTHGMKSSNIIDWINKCRADEKKG